jgi:class 3 adenylate cyclase
MTAQPPSGTVTFLLTDLEGSTRMWEQDPIAMKATSTTTVKRFLKAAS